jgi:hypothetical protein
MLRLAVLMLGVALLMAGVIAIDYGVPGLPLWLLLVGGTITAGTVFERVIYKPLLGKKPGPGWVRTAERSIRRAARQSTYSISRPQASGSTSRRIRRLPTSRDENPGRRRHAARSQIAVS